jgi:hypothetical protein
MPQMPAWVEDEHTSSHHTVNPFKRLLTSYLLPYHLNKITSKSS